jgi:hypothetical protein
VSFTPPDNETIGYLLVVVLSLLGAAARIMFNLTDTARPGLLSVIGQFTISLFAAALMLMVGIRFQWQYTGTAIACGVSAWSGATVVSVLESRLLARLSDLHTPKGK